MTYDLADSHHTYIYILLFRKVEMGTSKTLQFKIEFISAHVKRCEDNKEDILIDDFIHFVMCKLFCSKRTARELIEAVVSQASYKEGKLEFKKAYLFKDGTKALPS